MTQKRLSKTTFKKMLRQLPEFPLVQSTFRHNTYGEDDKRRCGGCAMTLAFAAENPNANLARFKTDTRIVNWANKTYGQLYVEGFISGFDGGHYVGNLYTEQSYDDGVACREMAEAMGRLEEE